ncbi:MAG: amidohydrolase [Bacteroidetes bacterium]|nr:MAG: amidohydrolase [Bacteroidota bacterium]
MGIDLKEKIKQLASEYFTEVQEIRRHFHQYPELSMQEHQTAKFIIEKLDSFGISYQSGIAKNGIVALIHGMQGGEKVVALRADMDALPIEEANDAAYKSLNPGVMHACGHDAHMASLLGTAKILHNTREHWGGTVKLIFQPSEESYPGGASLMIGEGILENPAPQSIFGQHVAPQIEAGKVGIRSGMYMASTDEVYLTVKGKGGHAATPHLTIDPVLIASHIVVALQQIVSRHNTPWIPTVLSFGRIIGDGRMNVIPDTVTIDGTFRTFNEKWRSEAHEKISQIAQGVAVSMGGNCEIEIKEGYPFLKNDELLSNHFRDYASEYLGKENIVELDLAMTAEDFAFYSQKIPACFYRLGIGNKAKGVTSNVHTSTFDIDEKALETGMGFMAWIVVNQLKE